MVHKSRNGNLALVFDGLTKISVDKFNCSITLHNLYLLVPTNSFKAMVFVLLVCCMLNCTLDVSSLPALLLVATRLQLSLATHQLPQVSCASLQAVYFLIPQF